jgi:hypothetical protein
MAGSSLLSVQVLPLAAGPGHGKEREIFCPIFITWGNGSQDNKGITRMGPALGYGWARTYYVSRESHYAS